MNNRVNLDDWLMKNLTVDDLTTEQCEVLSQGIVDGYSNGMLDRYTQSVVECIEQCSVSADDYVELFDLYYRLGNQLRVVDETGMLDENNLNEIAKFPFQIAIQNYLQSECGPYLVVEQHAFNTFLVRSMTDEEYEMGDFKEETSDDIKASDTDGSDEFWNQIK